MYIFYFQEGKDGFMMLDKEGVNPKKDLLAFFKRILRQRMCLYFSWTITVILKTGRFSGKHSLVKRAGGQQQRVKKANYAGSCQNRRGKIKDFTIDELRADSIIQVGKANFL